MTAMVAGIDVSKRTPDIHVNGRDFTATNDTVGLRRVGRLLREGGATRAVMEATGRMHRALLQSLHARGFATLVVNPRQARDLPKAAGALGRTDRVDARILAAFGAAFPDMRATAPAAAAIDRLRDMLVLRDRPVDQRAGTGTVVSEVGAGAPGTEVGRVLEDIDAAIAALERRIGGTVAGSPEFADSHRILTSVPGIGPVTAAALVAWMAELGAIGNRQAASLLGVAPLARDSGTLKGGRHIGGGRRRPRDVVYMAALSASRCSPDMRELYDRLRGRGKPHRVALVAVMRRLVVTANALLRDRRCGRTGRRPPPDGRPDRVRPAPKANHRRAGRGLPGGRFRRARTAPPVGNAVERSGTAGHGTRKKRKKSRIRA